MCLGQMYLAEYSQISQMTTSNTVLDNEQIGIQPTRLVQCPRNSGSNWDLFCIKNAQLLMLWLVCLPAELLSGDCRYCRGL